MKKGAGGEEEISDMELDAVQDHAQAAAQMDGTPPMAPRRRRIVKKLPTDADKAMEENTKNDQGKRAAAAAGAEDPPAPKCLQLPKAEDVKDADAAKALAASAAAEAKAAKAKEELETATGRKPE